MRKAAAEAGLADRVFCDSAGLADWQAGKGADPRAVRAGFLRGYELVECRARAIDDQDFQDFDLLIGMDSGHTRHLQKLRPREALARIARFLDFSPEIAAANGPDVPDPYTGTEADFEHALDLIEQGTPGLLDALRRDFLSPSTS